MPDYFTQDDCALSDFAALLSRTTTEGDTPSACDILQQVPIYDCASLAPRFEDSAARRKLMAEWARILLRGAGVLALRNAVPDHAALDAASELFGTIIDREKAHSGGGGDHFAAAGANDRIWNALQKLCLAAPDIHLRCFAAPAIDTICEAWLGPGYQMTAQVNLVHPGGAAQQAHRDYHLGFATADEAARYPAHVHALSPTLTLQGAVAHCEMPLASGPTKLLPFSQTYPPGYLAYRLPAFRDFFETHCIQIPLRKGDALFFNPALFHAAGANITTDVHRLANLLQVSSPMGRAMESLDRVAMCKALYPAARSARGSGALSETALSAAIAATAEGYAFPTNLDSDPPLGGLAPKTQAALFHEALAAGLSPEDFNAALDEQEAKRRP